MRILGSFCQAHSQLDRYVGAVGGRKGRDHGAAQGAGPAFHFAVTATTRSPRANEVDGVDYYFVDQAGFEEMIANDALLEHAEVYGNHYGVPKAPVRQALLQGQDVIVRVDVQGVVNLQRVVPEAIYIFIAPPSMGALKDRILHRAADRPDDIERRMGNAVDEMKAVDRFDYVITNYEGELEIAVAQLDAIVVAENAASCPGTSKSSPPTPRRRSTRASPW